MRKKKAQEVFVEQLVKKLKLSQNYLGAEHMADALILLDEDLSRMYCIQKLIYGEIAEKRNCTAISVERNMRTFLKHAWEEGDRKVLDDLAGYHMEKRPSNKRFLDLLLMRYQESMDEI